MVDIWIQKKMIWNKLSVVKELQPIFCHNEWLLFCDSYDVECCINFLFSWKIMSVCFSISTPKTRGRKKKQMLVKTITTTNLIVAASTTPSPALKELSLKRKRKEKATWARRRTPRQMGACSPLAARRISSVNWPSARASPMDSPTKRWRSNAWGIKSSTRLKDRMR